MYKPAILKKPIKVVGQQLKKGLKGIIAKSRIPNLYYFKTEPSATTKILVDKTEFDYIKT